MAALTSTRIDLSVARALVEAPDGRVLLVRRASWDTLPGLWELPGGKVHAGEDDVAALVRECREELGVTVRVGTRVGADLEIGASLLLRVWWARLLDGTPQPLEHTQLRWLSLDALDDVAWLPSDGPVMAAVRAEWPDT